ncbi:MAG: glutamine synthetase family protein, partial [Acidimicrobiales bacterium]
MTTSRGGTGRTNLAQRAGIDTAQRSEAADAIAAEAEDRGLHSIRLAFADQHGVLRGKTLRADLVRALVDDGVGVTSALLMKDTAQNNIYPVWAPGAGMGQSWLTGAGDMVMLPDPTTFKILPWAAGTGWLLCDLFTPDGEAVGLSTRAVCARAEKALTERGYDFRAGLEIEFHLYTLDDPGMEVVDTRAPVDRLEISHTHLGRVYLGERRYDQIEPFLEVLRHDLSALGLAPRSMEIELGPSQVELTFLPTSALEAADQAVLLRSAVKQISHRHGLHATFMGRPNIANSFTSGWHLHQSLVDTKTDTNVFPPEDGDHLLSEVGSHFVSGLLAHAAESCLLTTPTVTGYKRYRPESLAPDRITWGAEHRGAMLRVVGGIADPATRVENRIGDSAANPYLYLASQMLSGLAGIDAGQAPPPPSESPYDAAAVPLLPRNLGHAIAPFESSEFYRAPLGNDFVVY